MNSSGRSDRPFLPGDIDVSRSLWRALTSRALCEVLWQRDQHQKSAEQIVVEAWPGDRTALAITRGSVSPTGTAAGAAFQATAVAGFLSGLVPQSGAAQLIAKAVRVNLDRFATVTIPRASTSPAPLFIAEGAPIPVAQPALTGATLGPMKKMAMLQALTNELNDLSAEAAETVVRTIMTEAAAKALDAAIFSATPADATRPAGIFFNVTPITATPGGSNAGAAAGDVGNLVGAIGAAGGGASVVLVADYATAARLQMFVGPRFSLPVIGTSGLPAKTLAAVEALGFASAFGPDPQIDVGREGVLHMEDTAPLAIGTAGSPATIAAPTRSLWQTDSYALKLILRCSWAVLAPGLVQRVDTVTW